MLLLKCVLVFCASSAVAWPPLKREKSSSAEAFGTDEPATTRNIPDLLADLRGIFLELERQLSRQKFQNHEQSVVNDVLQAVDVGAQKLKGILKNNRKTHEVASQATANREVPGKNAAARQQNRPRVTFADEAQLTTHSLASTTPGPVATTTAENGFKSSRTTLQRRGQLFAAEQGPLRPLSHAYRGPLHLQERFLTKKAKLGSAGDPSISNGATTTLRRSSASAEETQDHSVMDSWKSLEHSGFESVNSRPMTETPVISAGVKKYRHPRLVSKVLRVADSVEIEKEKPDFLEDLKAIYNSSCPTTQRYIEEVLNRTINPRTQREYFLHHRYLFKPEFRNLFVNYSPRATLSDRPFQLKMKKAQEIARFIVLAHDVEEIRQCSEVVAPKKQETSRQPIWRI